MDMAHETVSRTYTTNADFDEGVLVGVEHDTVADQLQLSQTATTLPYIWVPNNEGTVSKVSTETGHELGRYRVAPPGLPANGSPSRTAVDLDGNCWIANRTAGTVVKIGLYEAGQYIDRNVNGTIETSRDFDTNGDITGAELLPWGDDECVLFEVVLVPGHEGVYAPGEYTGPYDPDVIPRAVVVDWENNIWVGTFGTQKYYRIDGKTGRIVDTFDVASWGHYPYGAVIDREGILWSSGDDSNHLLRLVTIGKTLGPLDKIDLPHFSYGVGLDYLGNLFVTGWDDNQVTKLSGESIVWTLSLPGLNNPRGIVCTQDNHIWVANSFGNTVTRYTNDGDLVATIPVGAEPTGVAVGHDGMVWVTDNQDEFIHRIDPATNSISLSKSIIGSGGHYTYSDMTGIVTRSITTKLGIWTVTYDSESADTIWGILSWHSQDPPDLPITVQARSSTDGATWSNWETATNGKLLFNTPHGRYLQVEAKLQQSPFYETTPILYNLTISSVTVEEFLRATLAEVQRIEGKLDGTVPSLVSQIQREIQREIVPGIEQLQDWVQTIKNSLISPVCKMTTGPIIRDIDANSLVVGIENDRPFDTTVRIYVHDLTKVPRTSTSVTQYVMYRSGASVILPKPPLIYAVEVRSVLPSVYLWTSTRTNTQDAPLEASNFISENTVIHRDFIPKQQ